MPPAAVEKIKLTAKTYKMHICIVHVVVVVLRLRNDCAPSRHSGESSLSPNDPNSSLTRMSAYREIHTHST